eukprot:388574-Pyramimonas_sp.AAC.1
MARTRGRVLEQSHRPVPQVDEPSSNVCVYPTESQLEILVEYLSSRQLTAVSIGCGEGFLEGGRLSRSTLLDTTHKHTHTNILLIC